MFILSANIGFGEIYNIVNSIFPIGIFLISLVYVFCNTREELIEEGFNFTTQNRSRKTFYTLWIILLLLSVFLGIEITMIINDNYLIDSLDIAKWISRIHFPALIILMVIILIIIGKEEKIINYLTKRQKPVVNLMFVRKLILIISGIVLGVILSVIQYASTYINLTKEEYIIYTFLVMSIICLTFVIASLLTFLNDIFCTQEIALIGRNDKKIGQGKIFKVVDDFIVLVNYHGDIQYINKSEVKKIECLKQQINNLIIK